MKTRIPKSALALLLFATVTSALRAQAPLFRELGTEFAGVPSSLWSHDADFDLDGDTDLATVTAGGAGLVVRLFTNDGTGRYVASGTPAAMPPALDVYGMSSGDVDGDGKPDLILATLSLIGTADIDFYLCGPTGFSFAPGFAVGPGCSNCFLQTVAGDFDGDGLADLVLSDFVGAPRYYRNSPGLAFTSFSAALPPLTTPVSFLPAGDQDGDGDRDLFAVELFASVRVLTNNGGVFTAGPIFFAPPFPAYWAFAPGDFDGDGVRDVVVSPLGAGVESLVSFAAGAPVVLATATRAAGMSPIGGLDIDGDGLDEVVLQSLNAVRIEPRGPGPVLKSVLVDASANVRIFDADRDGDRDLFVSDGAGDRFLRVRGDGTLIDASLLPALDFGSRDQRSILCDVDGDGMRDLVSVSYSLDPTSGNILSRRTTAWNDGRGRFTTGAATTSAESFLTGGPAVAADLDGDGDEDLAEAGTGKLTVWVSDGAGGFARLELGLPDAPSLSMALAASDLDHDGDLDLVIARGSPRDDVLLVVNQGTAGPAFVALSVASANVVDCVVADVDQNGFDDIVVASFPTGASTLFLNVGGLLSWSQPFGSVPAQSVSAGDVDGDGLVDLLFGDVVYLNAGGAFLTGPSTPSVPGEKRRLFDLDGDGAADLVAADSVRRAIGGGSFGPIEALPSGVFSSGPAFRWLVDDLDRDGDKDLADANGRVFWNSTAQLAAGSTASLGRTFQLEIYGPPGAPFDLFGSFAAAGTSTPIPGWGLLGIDQNSAFHVTSGSFDATGAASVVFQAPTNVAFEGLNLYWQAGLPSLSRLTGTVQTTLLRF